MMLILLKRSGRADLNRRPPGPEPGALAGLSHAPNRHDYTLRPSFRARGYKNKTPRTLNPECYVSNAILSLFCGRIRHTFVVHDRTSPGPEPGAPAGLSHAPNRQDYTLRPSFQARGYKNKTPRTLNPECYVI